MKTVGRRENGEEVKLGLRDGQTKHIDNATGITFSSEFESGNLSLVLTNNRVAGTVSNSFSANPL